MSLPPAATAAKVLVIDDDKDLRYSLRRALAGLGHQVLEADSGETGVALAKREQPDVILLDNRMGGMSGIETLQMLRGAQPQAMVILMTAFGTTQTAIEAMKFGAYDYVMKPFDQAKLITLVDKALGARRDLANAGKAGRSLVNPADYKEGIVGSSEPMQEVLKSIGQVAASEATVLITGESGTGKELVAQAVHKNSPRAKQRFVAINCAAETETLLEDQLFGHVRGAFTGAEKEREGVFEYATNGTLFLDEIGDMPLKMQAKLLRVLETGTVVRLGSNDPRKTDVRLVSATNKDLNALIARGEFREDLYFRIKGAQVQLPPLRERREDIPRIVQSAVARAMKAMGREHDPLPTVTDAAMMRLTSYHWPGNVRQLLNVVQNMAVQAMGEASGPELTLDTRHIPDDVRVGDLPEAEEATPAASLAGTTLEQIEKRAIRETLRLTGGNREQAAKLLGIGERTLYRKLKEYGVR